MFFVLMVIIIIFDFNFIYSQINFEDDRAKRYQYIFDECIKEDFALPECFIRELEKWELHLDSITNDFLTKLNSNNLLKEYELFKKNQNDWQKFYESQNNFDQEFLWNTWIGFGNHYGMKSRIFDILIYRCLEIEDDIERLESFIENNKTNIIKQNGIPPDGEYIYQVRFQEWQNAYYGDDVKIVIKGDTIKVYLHSGELSKTKIGDLIEEGYIRYHQKSGNWIIIKNEEEINAEYVGGCTGGPNVINFDEQYYLLC